MKNSKIIKAGLGYTVGNYLLKGLSFLTIPIFTRLLSTSDYGVYNTYLAYESILFIVIGLELNTSFKNAKYKYKSDFDSYVSSCALIAFISLAVWLILANALYPLYDTLLDFRLLVVNILILHSFSSAMIKYYNVYIGLEYKYWSFLKISGINAVSSIVLSIIFILIFNDNRYLGRIIGTALPMVLIMMYIAFFFFKKSKPTMNAEYWRYALKYSAPIIPHGISQVVLSQFDRIMIKSISGSSHAGIYSFSYNIYTIIMVTASSLDNVWGPWFYERMENKDYNNIRNKGGAYALGMLIFSSLIMMISPELVKILSPKEYWNSVYVVVPIVVGGYFSFLYSLPAQVEYYFEKTKFIALGTICAAVLNIVLNFLFIKRFGYIAAAYTTLITYLLYFIFHYIIASKINGYSLYSTKTICICVLSVLIIGAMTLLLLKMVLIRWILAVSIAFIGMMYFNMQFNIISKIKNKFLKNNNR